MKFVIACGIVPPDIGGPATVVGDFVQRLLQAKHEVVVVTYTESPLEINGTQVISAGRKGNVFSRYLRFFKAIRSVMEEGTVLIATDCFSTGIPARFALIGRANLFFLRLGGEWRWEHAIESGRYYGTLKSFWNKSCTIRDYFELILYRWLFHRATRILMNSEWFLNILSTHVPARYALYRAPIQVKTDLVKRDKAFTPPARMLYVGRFAKVKNVPFFARVLKELHEEGLPICMTFVGSGETKKECERILEGISGITFTGRLSHVEIQELMQRHDVFILPSLSDIYPNAILEAMAYGLPCILTSEHGLSVTLSGVIQCHPQHSEEWRIAIKDIQVIERYREMVHSINFIDSTNRQDFISTILSLCESSK